MTSAISTIAVISTIVIILTILISTVIEKGHKRSLISSNFDLKDSITFINHISRQDKFKRFKHISPFINQNKFKRFRTFTFFIFLNIF